MVITQIQRYTEVSKKIAENDLSELIEIDTHDEFETLGNTFNLMSHNLRVVLQENLNAAEQLAVATGEMGTMTDHASKATAEVTGIMDKMARATSDQYENVRLQW